MATAQSTPIVQPYIFFGGQCEEALQFYSKALGAKVGMVMRFNDSPDPVPEGRLQPGFENKVMHSEFTVGNTTLMASDGCAEDERAKGFSLSLMYSNEAEARQAFDALAPGGQVTLPMGKTFWSPCFGMLTDRFGIGWMIGVHVEQN